MIPTNDSRRFTVRLALLPILFLANADDLRAQKVLEENPYYLRHDKRLQVTVHPMADHPKLGDLLSTLREATGLDLAIDSSLQDHDPDFGSIQVSKNGYRAWQIMEMIARKDLERGYWDKTDGGYRLAGTSLLAVAATPPPSAGNDLGIWLGVCLATIVVVALLLRKRFRRTRLAAPEKPSSLRKASPCNGIRSVRPSP